jgi:murein L,D-transpeptidase YafK
MLSSLVRRRSPLPAILAALALVSSAPAASDAELRIDRIVVHKGARRMDAFDRGALVRTYAIAIGGGGPGAKLYEGDRRTPEGTYRIDSRHRSAAYHRFLHISYPSAEDRRRHRAARRDGIVPRGVGVGGDVGIHGSPRGLTLLAPSARDAWTDGCIAVTNQEIEELFDALIEDAIVVIGP